MKFGGLSFKHPVLRIFKEYLDSLKKQHFMYFLKWRRGKKLNKFLSKQYSFISFFSSEI